MTTSLSQHIWETRYRHRPAASAGDRDIGDTWQRVARAVAAPERRRELWERAFRDLLADYRFLPGGRILAGAGTGERATLFNCFVMGRIPDSIDGIFDALRESAVTLQQGGGIGCDFSTLRPAGSAAVASGAVASGPLSFMRIWDRLCETLLSTSPRRGAMMATLRCDHPDIERFIDAKRARDALRNFNLSVLVSDAFLQTVDEDGLWPLRFPGPDAQGGARVFRERPARALWRKLAAAAHAGAEPGVLFVDRINAENNLWYRETISATNPCGEIPLPPYGACNLGSVNLARFVRKPFTRTASLDLEGLVRTVHTAVRFLDNVIDVSLYPLPQQAEQARATRRIGIGVTALADMLVMLGLDYDSEAARERAAGVLRRMRDAAYAASVGLAREKGAFPALDRERHLESAFLRRLPAGLRKRVAEVGIRNSHLLAIAPTGTISLLADNVSSGIEPIYALDARRDVRDGGRRPVTLNVRDHAYRLWLEAGNGRSAPPDAFVTAEQLSPRAHLAMQATLQQYVDNAIAKTINLPAPATVDDVADIYRSAHAMGVKGCTVYRPGGVRGQVLCAGDATLCGEPRTPAEEDI